MDLQDGRVRTWYVFETIVADGSWSIGIGQGTPNPELVLVVAEGLTRAKAERKARLQALERDIYRRTVPQEELE